MTLDPVHVNGIAELASAIARSADADDHDDLAETVWREWLAPLTDGSGRTLLEPIDGDEGPRRHVVAVDDVALTDRPFETVHGLDSGTINPTAFTNGLVLDVAQAAMAADPSDLEVHRQRSLVATVHAADATVDFGTDWVHYDDGYSRRRVIHAPRVSRYAEGVVHALALYLAESEHALLNAHVVEELLVLDGPLYPTELLSWRDRDEELRALAADAQPRGVLENYVRLVERLLGDGVALAGFVKNPASGLVTRTLRERGIEAPWVDDAAMFRRVLDPAAAGDGAPTGAEDDDPRDRLTFTSWFRSRGGADRTMASDGDALDIERRRDPADYEVTFCVVYDPRDRVVFRLEAPYGVTRDPEVREALTRQVLRDVAASRGPPAAVAKADALARISRGETAAIRERFEETFEADSLRTYDDVRWTAEET
jgi:hypothetical protein